MQYIDLTMPLNSVTPVYPGDRKPEFKQVAFTEEQGWNLHEFGLTTHTGTHLDAPWHMLAEGKRITDFPVDRFFGRAVMFDVRGQSDIIPGNMPKKLILAGIRLSAVHWQKR
jgi:arylformamidase